MAVNTYNHGEVLWMDTEGSFSPERIDQLCMCALLHDATTEQVLFNISYARTYTNDEQLNVVTEMKNLLKNNKFRLIIIDGAWGLFRTIDNSTTRYKLMKYFLNSLKTFLSLYEITIVITNRVTNKYINYLNDDKSEDIISSLVTDICNIKIELNKYESDRNLSIRYSSFIDTYSQKFLITNYGLMDDYIEDSDSKKDDNEKHNNEEDKQNE